MFNNFQMRASKFVVGVEVRKIGEVKKMRLILIISVVCKVKLCIKNSTIVICDE